MRKRGVGGTEVAGQVDEAVPLKRVPVHKIGHLDDPCERDGFIGDVRNVKRRERAAKEKRHTDHAVILDTAKRLDLEGTESGTEIRGEPRRNGEDDAIETRGGSIREIDPDASLRLCRDLRNSGVQVKTDAPAP